MTYVLQLSEEAEDFRYSTQLLKSLHFMMSSYALTDRPGRWRAGPIYVHREETDEIVHEGVDIDFVSGLMSELVDYLNTRYYVASDSVRKLLRDIKIDRAPRDERDPFAT
ncbi:MAG: hypothetical protein ABI047_06765 [Jatrophihabitantaceae bacterium]